MYQLCRCGVLIGHCEDCVDDVKAAASAFVVLAEAEKVERDLRRLIGLLVGEVELDELVTRVDGQDSAGMGTDPFFRHSDAGAH
ncbi:MAG: hypothetical protein JWN12_90 [Candidatus Saccharibacteria bacterium]|nr:hypothetical protein [Candidatus Saccharibacteria bacterium]